MDGRVLLGWIDALWDASNLSNSLWQCASKIRVRMAPCA